MKRKVVHDDKYGCYCQSYVDMLGNPVEKTKEEYPYSYDPYVVFDKREDGSKFSVVYSDRLIQWNHKKYDISCREVWNNERQYFSNRQPNDIEKFLCLYFGYKVKLVLIMEGCNVSNGYPYWVFGYEKEEQR